MIYTLGSRQDCVELDSELPVCFFFDGFFDILGGSVYKIRRAGRARFQSAVGASSRLEG